MLVGVGVRWRTNAALPTKCTAALRVRAPRTDPGQDREPSRRKKVQAAKPGSSAWPSDLNPPTGPRCRSAPLSRRQPNPPSLFPPTRMLGCQKAASAGAHLEPGVGLRLALSRLHQRPEAGVVLRRIVGARRQAHRGRSLACGTANRSGPACNPPGMHGGQHPSLACGQKPCDHDIAPSRPRLPHALSALWGPLPISSSNPTKHTCTCARAPGC